MSVINRGFFDEAVQAAGEEINYLADINEDTVEESQYEIGLEGTMMHLYEAEEAWNKIQTYVAIEEFMGFKETGDTEYVLEGEKSENFFTSVINWFRSMGAKIVATFKKFFNYMASKVKSDKGFVKKFGGQIGNLVIPAGFRFKGYKFNIDSSKVQDAVDACDKFIDSKLPGLGSTIASMNDTNLTSFKNKLDEYNSQKENYKDMLKAAVVGQSGSLSDKEFGIELTKIFRSGAAMPESLAPTKSLLEEYLKYVTDHSANVKKAKESMTKIKDTINKKIKLIEDDRKGFKKDEKSPSKAVAMSYAHAKISLCKDEITYITRLNGALISALHQQNRQAKSVIYAVNARQTKAVGESAIYTRLGNF